MPQPNRPSQPDPRHLVFVYGSLLRDEPNHARYLDRARFVGNAWTRAEFTLFDLGAFPGLRRGGDTIVRGELYEVDDALLAALDRLEGHPTFYRREEICLADGRVAQGYVLARPPRAAEPIPSGRWRLARRRQDHRKE